MTSNDRLSVFISLILRHKPEVIGIKLDKNGWANVTELINGINKTRHITMEQLEEIVRTDKKQRYSFNEDHSKIRANQGHSVNVDVELKKAFPPDILYHGTCDRFLDSIQRLGLQPQSRQYVHLSSNVETAMTVGKRHGNPVVLKIDARQMEKDGYQFFISENKVWLTKKVPSKYLKQIFKT